MAKKTKRCNKITLIMYSGSGRDCAEVVPQSQVTERLKSLSGAGCEGFRIVEDLKPKKVRIKTSVEILELR